MNESLIMRLSNADAIAGDEDEVRSIMLEECSGLADEVLFDGLGSAIFHKRGNGQNPVKLLFMAHMDEVGFIVRSISGDGMLYLLPVGGVLDKSKEMQLVRVTTLAGEKYDGIMNVTRDGAGKVADIYVDLGLDSAEEVRSLGVAEGDRVCFATEARMLQKGIVAGKAMDDRTGCYVIAEALRALAGGCENDVYFAATSSEEVGTRGGRTSCELVRPDLAVAVDTANHPELDRGFKNHRLLGHGPMLEHYDKTMSPNRRLLAHVRALFEAEGISYQRDLMGGGGTDAGSAHLVGGGRLALVLGVPLRYCHGSCSLVSGGDLDAAVRAVVALCRGVSARDLAGFTSY